MDLSGIYLAVSNVIILRNSSYFSSQYGIVSADADENHVVDLWDHEGRVIHIASEYDLKGKLEKIKSIVFS